MAGWHNSSGTTTTLALISLGGILPEKQPCPFVRAWYLPSKQRHIRIFLFSAGFFFLLLLALTRCSSGTGVPLEQSLLFYCNLFFFFKKNPCYTPIYQKKRLKLKNRKQKKKISILKHFPVHYISNCSVKYYHTFWSNPGSR